MSWEQQGVAAPGPGRLCHGKDTAVPAAAKQSHSCPVDPAPDSKVLTCLGWVFLASRSLLFASLHSCCARRGGDQLLSAYQGPDRVSYSSHITQERDGLGLAYARVNNAHLRVSSGDWKEQDCPEFSAHLSTGCPPS